MSTTSTTSAAAAAITTSARPTRMAYDDAEPVVAMWFDAEQAGRRLGVDREAMLDRASRTSRG